MKNNNTFSTWYAYPSSFGELRNEIDRVFDDFRSGHDWQPPCDIQEFEGYYKVTLDVPGVPKDQIKIELLENQLLISGERRCDVDLERYGSHHFERQNGRFTRSFTLPAGVDLDKIEATCQDGTLTVSIPKAEAVKPRQIKIGSGNTTSFLGKLIDQVSEQKKEKERIAS